MVLLPGTSPRLKMIWRIDLMEFGNGTRRRRLKVFRDPVHLHVSPEAYSATDFRTNISNLAEATRRLSTYDASQLDSEAVAAELRFIEQTLHGIRRLTQHSADHWPYR
jgi:hypothetical protein